jgi:hypothetical protein
MSAQQYRDFARECLRWSDESVSEEDRRHFIEMAKGLDARGCGDRGQPHRSDASDASHGSDGEPLGLAVTFLDELRRVLFPGSAHGKED